jgi:hypothetical protein
VSGSRTYGILPRLINVAYVHKPRTSDGPCDGWE